MSRKDIEYRPHVWPSVLQAAEWYEGEKAGLGGDFVDELETCFLEFRSIRNNFPSPSTSGRTSCHGQSLSVCGIFCGRAIEGGGDFRGSPETGGRAMETSHASTAQQLIF
jgi:hypothetical protein